MSEDLITDTWQYAANLATLRKRAGNISVERAAGMIGATRSSWHAWESGTRRPSQDSLKAIVETFDCPPDFIGYEPPRGWELVPSAWLVQQFEQLNEELRSLKIQVDRIKKG